MPTRAVLFDFDGVIADTENVHIAAWERTFAAMGWDVSPDDCARSAEIDDRQFLAEVFDRRGVAGDVPGWVRRKQDLALQMLDDYPRACPGVVELVERLGGRVRLAVVSSGWTENIRRVLSALRIEDRFERIIAKEDVEAQKPAPEGYRLALRRLGIEDPHDAIALEDSAPGLRAARGAGIRCIAVGRRSLPADLCGELVGRVGDLADLPEILRLLDLPQS